MCRLFRLDWLSITNPFSHFHPCSLVPRFLVPRFYRSAWNADAVKRWEFCLSVCLSVCPSVKRVDCDKMEEKSVQIFIPYERMKKMVGGGVPFYLKFRVNRPPLERNTEFEPIFASSASAVTPSEISSINTNRKSTTRFPISLRWSSYAAPKPSKRGFTNAKRPFFV